MGCCCSGHEEAKKTDLPPPMYGRDIHAKIVKQGFFDADFDVLDLTSTNEEGKPKQWMLMDAVGGMGASVYDYYLKYRHESMEESQILGCANMKTECALRTRSWPSPPARACARPQAELCMVAVRCNRR
jgi:hypothetical protein